MREARVYFWRRDRARHVHSITRYTPLAHSAYYQKKAATPIAKPQARIFSTLLARSRLLKLHSFQARETNNPPWAAAKIFIIIIRSSFSAALRFATLCKFFVPAWAEKWRIHLVGSKMCSGMMRALGKMNAGCSSFLCLFCLLKNIIHFVTKNNNYHIYTCTKKNSTDVHNFFSAIF